MDSKNLQNMQVLFNVNQKSHLLHLIMPHMQIVERTGFEETAFFPKKYTLRKSIVFVTEVGKILEQVEKIIATEKLFSDFNFVSLPLIQTIIFYETIWNQITINLKLYGQQR